MMINPVTLAKEERSRSVAISIAQRAKEERIESNRTTFTGFWRKFNPSTGLHTIELDTGGFIYCWSITGTGFNLNQPVTVSRAKGEVFGRVRVRR